MRRPLATLAIAATLLTGTTAAVAAPAALAVEPWQQVVDITFPTEPTARFGDTYTACRSGCARVHQAADLMGPRMMRLFSAVDGRVCSIDDGAEDSYGRHVTVCGDDGNRYRYLHLNNDTPGTDDGQAGLQHVYAPGIRKGVRVARGQHLAYMGDSGNAEGTAPHLHFDIYVPGVTNPWGEERINPYHSLMAALRRGDIPDGSAFAVENNSRVSGPTRVETAIAVARGAFESAPAAVLATASSPHDALVGGPLAAVLGGPVLITGPGELAAPVTAELQRLGVRKVVLVGAVGILADAVRRVLPGVEVEVVGTADPFTTSAHVAERVWELTGATGRAPAAPTPVAEVADVFDALPLELDVTSPVVGAPTLVVFEDGHRDGRFGVLDGAHVPGDARRLWVQLVGVDPAQVEAVSFHVGAEPRRDNRINTERQFPYDLGGTDDHGPGGVRPWWHDAGTQQLTAVVRWVDGERQRVTATFTSGARDGDGSQPEPPQGPARRAIVALGGGVPEHRSWPDALSASWYGSVRALPVLLTLPDRTPPAIERAVATLDDLVVAGGRAAVSDGQFERLQALVADGTRRLSGADRYATAAAVAQDLVGRDLVDESTVFVATGQNWPDAVAAGPAVAAQQRLLLLVDGGGDSPTAREAITVRAGAVQKVVVLGGPAAVSDVAMRKVALWAL